MTMPSISLRPESTVGPAVDVRTALELVDAVGVGASPAVCETSRRPARVGRGCQLPVSVLLIEEDPTVGRSLTRLLRLYGFPTRVLSSGRGAQGIQTPRVAAVLGVELPGGDGVQVARDLLARGCVRSVVFYTGCSDGARLRCAEQVGAVCAVSDGVWPLLRQLKNAASCPVRSSLGASWGGRAAPSPAAGA